MKQRAPSGAMQNGDDNASTGRRRGNESPTPLVRQPSDTPGLRTPRRGRCPQSKFPMILCPMILSRNDAVAGAPPARRPTASAIRAGNAIPVLGSPFSEPLVQRHRRAPRAFGRGEPPGRRRYDRLGPVTRRGAKEFGESNRSWPRQERFSRFDLGAPR